MARKKTTIKDTRPIQSSRELTPEGYLRANAILTAVGVQEYLGSELPEIAGAIQDKTYSVMRPAETVFADETISSLALKPLTIEHPDSAVDPTNFKRETVGTLGERAKKINGALTAPLILYDADTINRVNSGELSAVSLGYTADVIPESGEHEGVPYDFIFDGPMVVNHLALVAEGRCADACILDSKNKGLNMAELDMPDIVERVAEKVLPQMLKMMESDDFKNKLAEMVGRLIVKSVDGEDEREEEDEEREEERDEDREEVEIETEDAPVGEPGIEERENEDIDLIDEGGKCDEDREEVKVRLGDEAVKRAINRRVEVLRLCDKKSSKQSNLRLLQDSLKKVVGVKGIQGKSVDYLMGVAKSYSDKRDSAKTYLSNMGRDSGSSLLGDDEIATGAIALRNAMKFKGEK